MRSSFAVKALLVGAMIAAVTAGQPVFAPRATTTAAATDPTTPPVSTQPATSGPTSTGPTTSAPATAEPTATEPPSTPPTVTTSDSPPPTTTSDTPPPTMPPPVQPPPITGLPNPIPPVAVRPDIALDPAVTGACRDAADIRLTTKLALAQNAYNTAQRIYDVTFTNFGIGTVYVQDLALALIDLGQTTTALNNVKYELAKCQVRAGAGPNKDCVLLSLELNRVADLLAQRQLIVDAAKRYYDAIKVKVDIGSLPPQALVPAVRKWEDAKTMLKDAQQDERDVHTAVNQVAERCGFMRYPDPPPNAR